MHKRDQGTLGQTAAFEIFICTKQNNYVEICNYVTKDTQTPRVHKIKSNYVYLILLQPILTDYMIFFFVNKVPITILKYKLNYEHHFDDIVFNFHFQLKN